MFSRRDFLKSSPLLSLSPVVPSFLASTARAAAPTPDSRVLVVIDLDGGNDGINTVVPFADEGYAKNRRTLRLPKDRILKVNDRIGLHPSLSDFDKLLQSDRLAIVQGVGYPNPNGSHGESYMIWQTAQFTEQEQREGYGWLGRALSESERPSSGGPASLSIGTESPPTALRGKKTTVSALNDFEDFAASTSEGFQRASTGPDSKDDLAGFVRRSLLDGYLTADSLREASRGKRTDVVYPQTELARRLGLIASALKAELGTRIFYTNQSRTGVTPGGYDTHATQLPAHALLLSELGGALRAFLDDLAAAKIAERVAVLIFSEFGRRVAENGSGGTDHGTAGPVFLAGAGLKGRLFGEQPSLLDLDNGNLKMTTDFRQVYADILEDWLDLPAKTALGGKFKKLELFRPRM
jgi:uncharacterized protein (DUF1501 family)